MMPPKKTVTTSQSVPASVLSHSPRILKNQSANADVFQGAGLMKLDKKKRIGVLYSDCIISAACTESIEKAVRIIASQKYIDTELVEINADFPSSLKVLDNNGRNIDVLVNALGPYYPEGKLPEILQYYRNGGTILNIGIKPFSVPYEVIDGTVCFHGEFNGAIRSLLFALHICFLIPNVNCWE